MTHINKMGIELEGAWHGVKGVPPFKGEKIKHDGSVTFYNRTNEPFVHYGEMVSPPLTPDKLLEWADKHIPTKVNDSCGTHIHVSLKSMPMYASLLTPTFQKVLIGKLRELNETIRESDPETYKRFLHRLDGGNRYCRKSYKGLTQVTMDHKGGERYQQLNYCYRLHGTLEIRVFPATTNKTFLADLIRLTQETIEAWVAKEHRVEKVRFRRA